MALLEITVTPTPEKCIELNQTFYSLLGNLQQVFSNFKTENTENSIRFVAELENEAHLKKVAASNDFILLLGAVRTLGIKSEILINGIESKDLEYNS